MYMSCVVIICLQKFSAGDSKLDSILKCKIFAFCYIVYHFVYTCGNVPKSFPFKQKKISNVYIKLAIVDNFGDMN